MSDTSTIQFENIGDASLKASCLLLAPPERVYECWTEGAEIAQWFGPREDCDFEVHRFDCKVGGSFDVSLVMQDGERYHIVGKYLELEPPRRLAFTWRWTAGTMTPQDTVVTVNLEPKGAGTLLTLIHEKFVSSEVRDMHSHGWEPCFTRLISYLAQS